MNTTLFKQAQAVLAANQTPHFTKPAPNLYPHQWNWDTGFIAIGYAHYDIERAIQEIRHLFQGQWANGMLPQVVFGSKSMNKHFPEPKFWQSQSSIDAPTTPQTSGVTMPPVHGFVLWQMYQVAAKKDRPKVKAFFKEMYPKVLALHRYLYHERDPLEEGLVYIRHPWEAGTDNSPTWDNALARIQLEELEILSYQQKNAPTSLVKQHHSTEVNYNKYIYLVNLFKKHQYKETSIFADCPFLIQDPLFNSILVWSNECMIKIGGLIKENVAELIEWKELTTYSMNEKLWDEKRGCYNAYDLQADEVIPCHTSSSMMPLIADIPTQEQAEKMLIRLCSPAFMGTEKSPIFLAPTYDMTAADVSTQTYWRGPLSINLNWLLMKGLARYDFEMSAEQIRTDSLYLLEKYGFYEYFDPRKNVNGNGGYGTEQFSWSAALAIDMLKMKDKKE